MSTVGAVRVRSQRAGQTGGVVAVVVAGVAGGAGLPLTHGRQRHRPRDILHADFRLHPPIQHLGLQEKKNHSGDWMTRRTMTALFSETEVTV